MKEKRIKTMTGINTILVYIDHSVIITTSGDNTRVVLGY